MDDVTASTATRSGSAGRSCSGLEVLVAADIVKTIAHELTFMSLGLLAGLVLIRTFLSWTLVLEIEGRWPWRREPTSRACCDRSAFACDSGCVSIQKLFGISVRRPFGRSSVPLRPRYGRGVTKETTNMFNRITRGRGFGRSMVFAGLAAGAAFVGVTSAVAGGCPAGKMTADVRQPATHAAKGVTDTVLAAIDLEKEPANIKERQLRFRKLTIEPGGIVPWHSHGDRPAIIYIAEGEIVEYASNCADPIVHKAGDIRPETSGTAHWWQNLGNKTVVLFVGDVLHDKSDHNM